MCIYITYDRYVICVCIYECVYIYMHMYTHIHTYIYQYVFLKKKFPPPPPNVSTVLHLKKNTNRHKF